MPTVYDVVFKGGGVKGVAYVGAMRRLEQMPDVKLRRLVGNSAGAIFATSFAAGYTADEMQRVTVRDVVPGPNGRSNFDAFLGIPESLAEVRPDPLANPRLSDGQKELWKLLNRFVTNQGRAAAVRDVLHLGLVKKPLAKALGMTEVEYDGFVRLATTPGTIAASLLFAGALYVDTAFLKWMGDRLAEKQIDPGITLRKFHETVSAPRGQQLTVTATDTTRRRVLVLNHRTAPDLPVVRAVRMSMSIPFVWPEVVWAAADGKYRGDDITDTRVVDGGALTNFPIRYLLDPRYAAADAVLGPLAGDARVLGLYLDAEQVVPDARGRAPTRPEDEPKRKAAHYWPAYDSALRIVDTMLDANDSEALGEAAARKAVICRIGTKGFSPLEFAIPEPDLKALINSGECAVAGADFR